MGLADPTAVFKEKVFEVYLSERVGARVFRLGKAVGTLSFQNVFRAL